MWLRFVVILLLLLPHQSRALEMNFTLPGQLALFLDQIGCVHRLHDISIVNSRDSISADYLDGLHRQLRANGSMHFQLLPQMTATDAHARVRFSALQDEDSLYVVFARDSRDPVIQLQAKRARGRRYSKTLFLLQKEEPLPALEEFFKLLWQLQFRSALVVVAQRFLYQMDPYPKLRIKRLSHYDLMEIFPPPNGRNLNGYELHLPVQLDVPNTFWSQDTLNHQWRLDGAGGVMLNQLMAHLNVSLKVYPLSVNGSQWLNMPAIIELIASNRIELSVHLYDTMQASKRVDYSYPVHLETRCFMIPKDNEISRTLYIFLPFQWSVWLSVLLTLLVVHFVGVRRFVPDSQLWALMGVPGCRLSGCYQHHIHRTVSCYLVLFGICLIYQLYSTKLTSFLTVSLSHKLASSLEEILRLPYPILAQPLDVQHIVGSFGHAEEFGRMFSLTDAQTFARRRLNMEPGYIYPISRLRWKFYNRQQRSLKTKLFYLSSLCHGTFAYQFQLRIDSHFKDPLHRFSLHVQEAGLTNVWLDRCYYSARRLGYVREFTTAEELLKDVRPLAFNLMAPAFSLFLFGLLVSFVVFLVEIRPQSCCRKASSNSSTH
ncbi:uncharacterized protein LOC117895697 [Drosophila subobscura]|uniref:uncharacterized protein LOC117895697 n=1 Tax=Drosophila subobscura TaxID=7241 RepID=UPI00155A150F|nr:uncharacterized protein LOC117895697 [Drosophila subobscura]